MALLTAKTCDTTKPLSEQDRLLGDGNGLFLRIRPNGTRTWVVEYEFKGRRHKYTIGIHDSAGATDESITAWLEHGRVSLSQARSIAGAWKADRRAGRNPVVEWEGKQAARRAVAEAVQRAERMESAQPTIREAIDLFMAKHINGKKSAPDIRYRLNRLATSLGDKKIRDVTRQEFIAALEKIAEGQTEGRTAKQLAGEILIHAKRVWRFAEWSPKSMVSLVVGAPATLRDRPGGSPLSPSRHYAVGNRSLKGGEQSTGEPPHLPTPIRPPPPQDHLRREMPAERWHALRGEIGRPAGALGQVRGDWRSRSVHLADTLTCLSVLSSFWTSTKVDPERGRGWSPVTSWLCRCAAGACRRHAAYSPIPRRTIASRGPAPNPSWTRRTENGQ